MRLLQGKTLRAMKEEGVRSAELPPSLGVPESSLEWSWSGWQGIAQKVGLGSGFQTD